MTPDATAGATFDLEPRDGAGDVIRGLCALDVDGDGAEESVFLSSSGLGTHAGGPHVGLPLPPPQSLLPLAPGDGHATLRRIDADGDAFPDLLVAYEVERELRILHGTGIATAPFTVGALIPHGVEHAMVDVGDIDGDGDLDAVVFGMAGSYRVLRRDPSGLALQPAAAGGPAEFLADVNGDGALDGVCCGGGGGPPAPGPNDLASNFEIALGDGAGGFAPAFTIPGLGSQQLAGVGDLDGDGDIDLVGGRAVYFARGDIGASFWATRPAPDGAWPVSAAQAFDQDGDGDIDLHPGLDSQTAAIGWGAYAAQTPAAAPAPQGTTFEGSGFPGDWDGDGDVDLVVEHRGFAGALLGMRLLLNAGGYYADGGPASAAGVSFANGSLDPATSLAVDVDGDGDLDLATRQPLTSTSTLSTRLWRNDGAGLFSFAQTFSNEHLLHVDDYNGDGLTDLISMVPAPLDPTREVLRARVGLPGGGLSAPTQPNFQDFEFSGRERLPVTFGSWTSGDDWPDIAISSGGQLWILITYGTPSTFLLPALASVQVYSDELAAVQVHSADLNGDGHDDMLGSPEQYGPRTMSIVHRVAPTSPALQWAVQPTQVTGQGALIDVDGDGDLDLVGDWIVENLAERRPASGERLQYGAPAPGDSGARPVLGIAGKLGVGQTPELLCSGSVGGGLCVLDWTSQPGSWQDFPAYGVTFHLSLNTPIKTAVVPGAGPTGVPGAGGFRVPLDVAPGWAGRVVYAQVFAVDFSQPGFLSASNGLRVQFGL